MQKVSGILHKLIRQYGLEGKMLEYIMAENWDAIVGKTIATHTRPTGIHYRKLYIVVDNPVWLQEISFYKDDLVNNVNKYFGKNVVSGVFLKVGE
jgi:predicted nucleic acid-binding Zn ribbon protein